MRIEGLMKQMEKTISEVRHNKHLVENVKSAMLDHYGVLRGQTQKIFNGDIPFEKLEKNLLIRFVIELFAATKVHNLSPYNYFTDKDISNAKKEDALKEDFEKFPIKINNVTQVDDQTYIAFINARDIVKLYNNNLLEYNYNINKRYKLVKGRDGKLIQSIDINVKEVKEIAEKILSGRYAFDKLILNVMLGSSIEKPEGQEIEYIKEDKELLIHQAQLDIVDGLHDISALMHVFNDNPEIELKIEVEIKHLDLQNIKAYFNKLNLKGGVN